MKEFIHESFKMDENKISNLEKHQDQEKKNQDQEKHHEQEHYTMINILNINGQSVAFYQKSYYPGSKCHTGTQA